MGRGIADDVALSGMGSFRDFRVPFAGGVGFGAGASFRDFGLQMLQMRLKHIMTVDVRVDDKFCLEADPQPFYL